MIKDKQKNKEIGIEKNLEFFADQVNENYKFYNTKIDKNFWEYLHQNDLIKKNVPI